MNTETDSDIWIRFKGNPILEAWQLKLVAGDGIGVYATFLNSEEFKIEPRVVRTTLFARYPSYFTVITRSGHYMAVRADQVASYCKRHKDE